MLLLALAHASLGLERGDGPRVGAGLGLRPSRRYRRWGDLAEAARLVHPVQEVRWLGVKVVSSLIEGWPWNLPFLGTHLFGASGAPRNEFRLFTEWHDIDGVCTGHFVWK